MYEKDSEVIAQALNLQISISKILSNFILEPIDLFTMNNVKKEVGSYLETIKERKAIEEDYKVDCKPIKYTWTKLYPNIFNRFIAIIIYYIGKIFKVNTTYSTEIKWYHLLLPYVVEFRSYTDWEEFKQYVTFEKEDIFDFSEKHSSVLQTADLITPYWVINVDVCIKPIKAVEFINISAFISPKIEFPPSNKYY